MWKDIIWKNLELTKGRAFSEILSRLQIWLSPDVLQVICCIPFPPDQSCEHAYSEQNICHWKRCIHLDSGCTHLWRKNIVPLQSMDFTSPMHCCFTRWEKNKPVSHLTDVQSCRSQYCGPLRCFIPSYDMSYNKQLAWIHYHAMVIQQTISHVKYVPTKMLHNSITWLLTTNQQLDKNHMTWI